jgi:hypothetical protein
MMAYIYQLEDSGGVPMDSTVTPTPPKFPEDFRAHFVDRIGGNAAEVDGDDVGVLLRDAAHQPDA